jgi:hypothetical protein
MLPGKQIALNQKQAMGAAYLMKASPPGYGFDAVGSRLTRMIFLPKFSPFKRRISSRGAFSSPSVMSSRYLMRPSLNHAFMSVTKSGNCEA